MDSIYLKGATPDDYEDYYLVRCTPTDLLWNGYKEKPNNEKLREVFLSRLETNPLSEIDSGRIYLIKKDDDTSVGFIHVLNRDDGFEIGYTVLDDYQGHGYATKALIGMVDLVKEMCSCLYLKIREDNIASQKVAYKAGFVKTDELSIRKAPMGEYVMRKYVYRGKED